MHRPGLRTVVRRIHTAAQVGPTPAPRKRIIGQCNERADERLAIDRCLSSPELLGGPLKDNHIVVLGWLG